MKPCHISVVEALYLPLCEGKPQGVALNLGLFYQHIRHVDLQTIAWVPRTRDCLSIYLSIYLSVLCICLSYLSFYPIYLSILSIFLSYLSFYPIYLPILSIFLSYLSFYPIYLSSTPCVLCCWTHFIAKVFDLSHCLWLWIDIHFLELWLS